MVIYILVIDKTIAHKKVLRRGILQLAVIFIIVRMTDIYTDPFAPLITIVKTKRVSGGYTAVISSAECSSIATLHHVVHAAHATHITHGAHAGTHHAGSAPVAAAAKIEER